MPQSTTISFTKSVTLLVSLCNVVMIAIILVVCLCKVSKTIESKSWFLLKFDAFGEHSILVNQKFFRHHTKFPIHGAGRIFGPMQ